MSRGEAPKPSKIAHVVPIAAGLVALLAVAGFLTVWAVTGVDDLMENGLGGPPTPPAEPFAGAHTALSGLRPPHCVERHGGPTVSFVGMPDAPDFDARVAALGFVADGDWSPSLALPLDGTVDGLAGSCGLVAVHAERGSVIDRGAARDEPAHGPCISGLLWVGACGGDRLQVSGMGRARIRSWAAPGLTPDTLGQTGLPPDIALAFADAEGELAARGWGSSESVVRVAVRAGAPGASLTVRPPGIPASGCRAWIAVGRGVELASALWPPGAGGVPGLTQRFVAPTVACGGSSPYTGTLLLADAERDGGDVWFRPIQPGPGGPALPSVEPRPPLTFAMRVVPEAEATLPPPVPENARSGP
jgi:hypothetical protein